MRTGFLQFKIRNFSFLILIALFISLILAGNVFAKKVTVNPGGAQISQVSYRTLDTCLMDIGLDVDTILLTKDSAYKEILKKYIDKAFGTIFIISNTTDPNKFPIIVNNNGDRFYNFFYKNNVYFERLTFSGILPFSCGDNDSTISFNQCAIKDYTDKFLIFTGKPPKLFFENCLITNDSDTLITFNWGSSPALTLKNCTIDNCMSLLGKAVINVNNISVNNCIFSNLTDLTSISAIETKINNSLFSQPITGVNSTCITDVDPKFEVATSRTKPTDWNLQQTSPALNRIDSINAPLADIGNQPRNVRGKSDLGCWELQNHNPTEISLTKTAIAENVPDSTVIGIFKTSDLDTIGESFTYALAGGTDNSSFFISKDTLKIKKSPNFELKSSYSIGVRSTDGAGGSITKTFNIAVTNVNESPTDIILSRDTIIEHDQMGTVVGTLSVVDPDVNENYTYTLSNGTGSTNNDLFAMAYSTLKTTKEISFPAGGILNIRIQAKNSAGDSIQKQFTIKVLALPVISIQPKDITVLAKDNATFTISSDATKFQWLRNNTPIPAETTSTLILKSVTKADSGANFICAISNSAGTVKSNSATLIVNTPATITAEPISQTVAEGDTCKFTIVATGSNVLSYSWYRNDTLIVQNTPTIYIPNVTIKVDSGAVYKCIVTNSFGSATSSNAILSVKNAKPVITVEPVHATAPEFQNAIFTVKAKGSQPIQYAWFSSLSTTPLSSKDTLVLSNVSKSDSGKTFYCIVSNGAGSDTSVTVQLHVGTVKPIITLQPLSDTIYEKTNAQFSVQVTGTSPLHYEWHKKSIAKDTVIVKDSSTLILTNVPLIDSGTSYYCIVSNVAGSDTSKEGVLNVAKELSKPLIILQPDTLVTKYVGDSIIIKVSAIANPKPLYQWFKNDSIIAGKTDTFLIINNLSLIDNKTRIYCVITNTLDTVNSFTTTLLVEPRPKAGFKSSVTSGALPLTVAFTDTSIGTITARTWDFGDGTLSVTANPTHVYSKAGQYSLKLIVTGPGGIDSIIQNDLIYAYGEGSNPIRMKAQYLKPSSIIVTCLNLSNVDVSLPFPIADSLGVWYRTDSLPVSPLSSSSIRVKVYPSTIFKNTAYIDTIPLPPYDSIYGLMNGIIWQDKKISQFSPANGCFALMRDTITPVNPVAVSGNHHKGDTVTFTFGNILAIDTTIIDSLALWYGLDTLSINYNAPPTIWYSSKVLRRLNVNQISYKIQNPLFADSLKVSYALICKGVNKKTSSAVNGFFITKSAITNPVALSAKAVSPGKIVLTWPLIVDTTISKIFIWKGSKEVPIGTAISDIEYDSVQLSAKNNSYSFTGLNANTTYFFGAGLMTKDGIKVGVSKDSRVSVTTPPPQSDTLPNKIILKKLEFDTSLNVFNVSWCLDMVNRDSILIGITYSTDGIHDVNTIQIVDATEPCGITTVKIPSVLFDTRYQVAMWLSKSESGVWSKPVSSSMADTTTPSFARQTVTIFEEGKKTITAANGTIKLWTDVTIPPVVDTIKTHVINTSYSGFQVANKGFYFAKKENTLPFNIGLTYPVNIKPSQIRMYREINGIPHVVFESKADTLNRTIYTLTNDLRYPFMLLIDTIKPVTTIKENDTIAILRQNIADTFSIKDNSGNVKWICRYSRGDGSNAAADSGYFGISDPKKVINITNSNIINEENGVRIHFIVDDGVYKDTINCSRRAFRASSDVKTTIPNQWFPLFVTANLSHNQPESILVNIKESDSLYDNHYARLFRWCSTKENSQENWVEYSQVTSALFTFTPGKIVWIKTLNSKTIDFGAGVTLSLKDTFEIKLPPLSWNDFGLPYHFDMKLEDILKSTKNSDSLNIYKWTKGSDGRYSASEFFLPTYSKAEWHDRNAKISYEDGYTIFNSCMDTVKLNFPPCPYLLSPVNKTLSKKMDRFWSVKIYSKDDKGTNLQDIHCGYSAGMQERYYPTAPTFLNKKIAFFDRTTNKLNGLFVTGKINNGGFAKEIALQNNSDSRSVFTYAAEHSGDFPSDFKTVFYNPVNKSFEESGSVSIDAHSTEYRWVITSNSAYLQNFFSKNLSLVYSLGMLYPNPCRSVLVIPFTIPLGSKDRLRFEIFDQLGRVLWKKEVRGLQSAGNHRIMWNAKSNNGKRISSGLYLLRFTTIDDKNKISSRFTNRFTLLP